MWGQDIIKINGNIWGGIIPTRVGTSRNINCGGTELQDHPHACGDKKQSTIMSSKMEGSSPRVWGQATPVKISPQMAGIIPTRVGTSFQILRPVLQYRDHPHACGDKEERFSPFISSKGSSPRVWGQANGKFTRYLHMRIIPTRVGTRKTEYEMRHRGEDHPHACGDKRYNISRFAVRLGSSPRVWGQGKLCENLTAIHRIIPTRVGTSYTNLYIAQQIQDHPHACGDKFFIQI